MHFVDVYLTYSRHKLQYILFVYAADGLVFDRHWTHFEYHSM